MNDIGYLTTKQAAAISGLSASYLNKLRSIGGGSPFLKIGRRCVYRRDQFDDWLSQHQRSSTSDIDSNAA